MKSQCGAALFAGMVVGVVACSGAAPSDLFSKSGLQTQDPAPTGAVVDDAGNFTSTPDETDATSGEPLGDAGTGTVHPTPKDGGVDAPVKDAAPPPPPPVTCGFKTSGALKRCAANDVCCFDSAATTKLACTPATTSCGGFVIACSSALECPVGKQCCGTFDSSAGYESVTCMDACPTPTTTMNYPQLCTGNPGECPPGTACTVSGTITGYSICK